MPAEAGDNLFSKGRRHKDAFFRDDVAPAGNGVYNRRIGGGTANAAFFQFADQAGFRNAGGGLGLFCYDRSRQRCGLCAGLRGRNGIARLFEEVSHK